MVVCKPVAYALHCHDDKDDLQGNVTLSVCVVICYVILVLAEKKTFFLRLLLTISDFFFLKYQGSSEN